MTREPGGPVLVTGQRGFIGRVVAEALSRRGIEWRPFEGDVLRFEDFASHEDCRSILHLAAVVRSDGTPEGDARLLERNVAGALNAIRFAAAGDRALHFSSTSTYDPGAGLPSREESPLLEGGAYPASKLCAEQLMTIWGRHAGLRGTVFRIFNVYGPGQSEGFLVPDLLRRMGDEVLEVRNLEDARDFVHVRDVADLMVSAILADTSCMNIVNVGTGRSVSVAEMLEMLFDLSGKRPRVRDLGLRSGIPRTQADTSRAARLFGWTPKIGLREGLAELLEGAAS